MTRSNDPIAEDVEAAPADLVGPAPWGSVSLFFESGALLNDEDLKAFVGGMTKEVKPTEKLIKAIRQAKAIRQF